MIGKILIIFILLDFSILNAIIEETNLDSEKTGPQITFLEFGSSGCIPCQMMEKVMREIRNKYPQTKVDVKFIDAKQKRDILKEFDVKLIPTQILLNREDKILFKHTGYISSKELIEKIDLFLSRTNSQQNYINDAN